MKLLWCQILRYVDANSPPVVLTTRDDLYNSFSMFQRGTVREILQCASRTFARRTKPGERISIPLDDIPYTCYVHHRFNGLVGVAIVDNEYPDRVIFDFIRQAALLVQQQQPDFKRFLNDQNLEIQKFSIIFAKYQSPEEVDHIMKIEKNLDECRDVCQKNIEAILERGENLDTLMEKSNDVSATSLAFYKQAKKANSCCYGIL
jgi:synaptobrevin family protein YKT6